MSTTDIPSPFDAATPFLVLVNARGERSLWPEWRGTPAGWTVLSGPAPREECEKRLRLP
ncbi:MbtH family NRPS accessory protein [Streptomyces abyssomicinicus]|uniref:MbtH family NRPS accessory protein n=1 Tax=Streptomyces abyssomicinicus TaxID=574929 RepID=UPI0013DF88D5|nr:MbtH family NRPS accessory protein [Streptomyces abyssomicinicus]